MKLGNFAFEMAELRAEQERQAGIARAQAAIRCQGSLECRTCGDPIDEERRKALPSADRCFGCQAALERLRARRKALRRPGGRG